MSKITVKDEEVNAALAKLIVRLTDPTEALDEIGEYIVDSTKRRFSAGVAPDGTPWAAKSLNTIASYRSRAGKKANSRVDVRPLFGPSGRLSSQIFHDVNGHSVMIGSNMVYAATMHFGAAKGQFGTTKRGEPIPFGTIPARPIFGVSETDRPAIGEIIAEWLTEDIDD